MRSQRRELWNRSAECMPERALSRTRRTGPLPALPSASSLTRRKSFPSLPWTWVYLSGRREGCSQRGPSAFSVWYDSWARTSHCLPSPCKTRNLVGRRPEPEIFPSPWLKFVCLFVFQVVLGLPFIMGKYWETLHLGYISVILPDTHCSTVRKEKTVNISCLEMISFRRAGAIFWACMERKTSESDVRTHVPGPPLTGCEIWVWSNR